MRQAAVSTIAYAICKLSCIASSYSFTNGAADARLAAVVMRREARPEYPTEYQL